MKFTYLLIDVASFAVPFAFSFHPKILFYKQWKSFLPSLFLVALLFCLWDSLFVHLGVWGFNEEYLTGIRVFNLPTEEILFFICIPYACVFTYFCLTKFVQKDFLLSLRTTIAFILAAILIVAGIIFRERLYPLTTFLALGVLLLVLARADFLGRFFFSYLILLIPFFIVNGVLTGSGIGKPVVWYNPDEIIGLRLFTIPVEDVFYGMLLILLNVFGMEILFAKRKS